MHPFLVNHAGWRRSQKFMECVHGKVAVINKTIGFLEAPYNPAPNARHVEYLAANAAYGA